MGNRYCRGESLRIGDSVGSGECSLAIVASGSKPYRAEQPSRWCSLRVEILKIVWTSLNVVLVTSLSPYVPSATE